MSPLAAVAAAATAAGLDDVVVVVGDEEQASGLPEEATVLLDGSSEPSESAALRAALDWCGRNGHGAVVVAVSPLSGGAPPALTDPGRWRAVADASGGPVVALAARLGERSPVRLDATVWPLLPLGGDFAALWRSRPELVTTLDPATAVPAPSVPAPSVPAPSVPAPSVPAPSEPAPSVPAPSVPAPSVPATELVTGAAGGADVEAVTALLGRPPAGAFSVAVRDAAGAPVVIENAPLLDDGTPMPTRWWLVGRAEREAVSRLESNGGIAEAEAAVPAEEVAAAHARAAATRDALLPPDHAGPAPSGGVGGTRRGVKCLHAHLAAYLAGDGDPVGRWVTLRLDGELTGAVAAVDCGTNSTRLLVAGPDGAQIERRMTITRLGEGVDADGVLSQAAVDRTLETLRDYRAVMDRHGVVRLRATATSAARDASNASSFSEPATAVLGVPLEILSGTEEGALSYAGATAGLDLADGPPLVVDLGGGSTELIARDGGSGELAVASIPAGCVRMTERFLHHDPPQAGELAAARSDVRRLVAGALATTPELRAPTSLVGVAGTITSLAALHLGLESYDPSRTHHSTLSRDDVEGLLAGLAALDRAGRRARRPLEPGRADVIVGGAVVLAALMEELGREHLVVSETDSLDGLVATLLGS